MCGIMRSERRPKRRTIACGSSVGQGIESDTGSLIITWIPKKAAEELGMELERYVEIKHLGRPTPEEMDKIVAVTGISREWLTAWANRPHHPTVTVIAPRM